jgi:hypothetical protein
LSISGSTTQIGNNTLIGTTTLTGSILISGDIIPTISSSFSLGSITNPWKDIWIKSASLNIQSDIPGGPAASISNANGNVTIQAAGLALQSGSLIPFSVTEDARVQITTPNIPGNDPGSLLIVASTSGSFYPVRQAGGLLHLVGPDGFNTSGSAARISIDSYGNAPLSSPFLSVKRARGTADVPSPVLSGDSLLRITAVGYATTDYNGNIGNSATSIEFNAIENFNSSSFGSNILIYTVPTGSTARVLAGTFDGLGLTTSGSVRASSFTGSLFGTSSFAQNALTASYAPNYVLTSTTSSMSVATASYVLNAVSSSYAATSSYAPNYVLTSATASMLSPYVLTSSTSSMSVATASYVQNAQTASYVITAQTASYVLQAVSASFASTSSYVNPLNQNVIITGSLKVSGSLTEIGSTVLSGSLTLSSDSSLNINDGFYVNGNKQYNYGQFSSTITQSGSADTAYSMTFNTTDFSNGITLVSGSRITIANTGIYNIQFSSQLHTTVNQSVDFSIWFAMTGSNVDNSNTDFSIEKVTGGGFAVAALNFLTQIASGSYVELKYSKTTNQGQLQAKSTQSTPSRPATPSVIVTVTQIA